MDDLLVFYLWNSILKKPVNLEGEEISVKDNLQLHELDNR